MSMQAQNNMNLQLKHSALESVFCCVFGVAFNIMPLEQVMSSIVVVQLHVSAEQF